MGIGGVSIWQLLIILAIIVLIFGTKRMRNLGSDLGNALRGFRKAVKEEPSDAEFSEVDESTAKESSIEHQHSDIPIIPTDTNQAAKAAPVTAKATRKPAARKAATTKKTTATKKPATKKPAARKPAAKKATTTKKTTTTKKPAAKKTTTSAKKAASTTK